MSHLILKLTLVTMSLFLGAAAAAQGSPIHQSFHTVNVTLRPWTSYGLSGQLDSSGHLASVAIPESPDLGGHQGFYVTANDLSTADLVTFSSDLVVLNVGAHTQGGAECFAGQAAPEASLIVGLKNNDSGTTTSIGTAMAFDGDPNLPVFQKVVEIFNSESSAQLSICQQLASDLFLGSSLKLNAVTADVNFQDPFCASEHVADGSLFGTTQYYLEQNYTLQLSLGGRVLATTSSVNKFPVTSNQACEALIGR